MSADRSLRSSQLISPYGPGAIVDIGDESLLLTDLRDWPANLPTIYMPRLITELGVGLLKSPPAVSGFAKKGPRNAIKTIRFPRWMFCPKCRRMEMWSYEKSHSDNQKPACSNPKCNNKLLAPMRLVMACDGGHLNDVPWKLWAHSGKSGKRDCSTKGSDLYFRNDTTKGSGLDALSIECGECGSKRNLGDITSPETIKGLKITCTGSQPWEKWEDCERSPVVLQRGASNLYYPIIRSALDVPNESSGEDSIDLSEQAKAHGFYSACLELLNGGNQGYEPLLDTIAKDLNSTPEKIKSLILGEEGSKGKREIPSAEELQVAEWRLLSSDRVVDESNNNFLARIESKSDEHETWGLDKLIGRIVLLDKLREVRAFCGFERVKPAGDFVIPPSGRHKEINWLPAVEVFGEGFFIQFSQDALVKWEKKANKFIGNRISGIKKKYEEGNVSYLPEPTPKLVMIHTLSHLLIRQLSFECGYSSGSIRERIYTDEDQVGLLIYTADSDSEGSLGGLVQQGEQSRIYSTLAVALEQASWCSNDPVCSEMETQGVMGLNKAACHSCTLVSETSCTMNNLMLDRKLLLGDENGEGFFTSVLSSIKTIPSE